MEEKKPSSVPQSGTSEDKGELDIDELREELKKCQREKEEYLAGWQRARADFLNYKKEELEKIGELINYAGEGFILKILPILDNFEVAEKKLPEDLKNDENVKGLLLIKNQLLDFLKNQGVEEIKSAGEKFDPNLHEVVEELELAFAEASTDGRKKSGMIIEEVQKGYKINDRLLRPAKVKVAK